MIQTPDSVPNCRHRLVGLTLYNAGWASRIWGGLGACRMDPEIPKVWHLPLEILLDACAYVPWP
jgi:hypothetical protein